MSVSGSTATWDFTINPDGSGKVEVVETLLPPMPPEAVADKGAEEVLRLHFLRETLFLTGGADVWAGRVDGEDRHGRLRFKGTAYFPDVTKVGLGPSRDGQLTWAKDPNGGMTLVAKDAGAPSRRRPRLREAGAHRRRDRPAHGRPPPDLQGPPGIAGRQPWAA